MLIGFLQDPIRKLLPGEPVFVTATIAGFLLFAFFAAIARGERLGMHGVPGWRRSLRRPARFMLVLIVIQAIRAFFVTATPVIPLIGLLSYLTPVPAVLIGIRVFGTPARVKKGLAIYVGMSALLAVSVVLGFVGYKSRILESVGEGLYIYSPDAGVLELQCGFMRATEVAAWHIGAGVAFAIILASRIRARLMTFLFVGLLIVSMGSTIFLTGRRKVLLGLVFFVLIYILALRFLGRSKRGSRTLMALVIVAAALVMFLPDTEIFRSKAGAAYVQRSTDTAGYERISQLANEVVITLRINGLLGSGAGLGAQGSQYYMVGTGAESGPGRVAAELGVPGLIGLAWIGFAFVRESRVILRVLVARDVGRFSIVTGFLCFLASNAAIFLGYHQIFGDLFVLTMLGFVVGGVLGLSRMEVAAVMHARTDPLSRVPVAAIASAARARVAGAA